MSIMFPPSMGYLGPPPKNTPSKVVQIDGEYHELHRVVVHQFTIDDLNSDPNLYIDQPLRDWEQSEQGKWIREHAIEAPQWHRHDDPMSFYTNYTITALLKERDYTLWILKYT